MNLLKILYTVDFTKYYNAVIVQEHEIFLMFHSISAISGHECPEKPETSMDAHRGRSRQRR